MSISSLTSSASSSSSNPSWWYDPEIQKILQDCRKELVENPWLIRTWNLDLIYGGLITWDMIFSLFDAEDATNLIEIKSGVRRGSLELKKRKCDSVSTSFVDVD